MFSTDEILYYISSTQGGQYIILSGIQNLEIGRVVFILMNIYMHENIHLWIKPYKIILKEWPLLHVRSSLHVDQQQVLLLVCMCVHIPAHHSTHREVRGQLGEISFLLPTRGSQESKSCCQVSLPTKSPCWPSSFWSFVLGGQLWVFATLLKVTN